MIDAHAVKRCCGSVALLIVGAVLGILIYFITMMVLAALGFYTLALGTAPFVALLLSLVGTILVAGVGRGSSADDSIGSGWFMIAGLLITLVTACVVAVVYTPELIAFWPH